MTKFSDTSERSQDLNQGQDSGVELLNLIMAYSISTSVRAAAQLGLADHLRNGSKTIDELARLTPIPKAFIYSVSCVSCVPIESLGNSR